MDIDDTLAPKSTQLDAIDLDETGRVFTITAVKVVEGDQPVHISLAGFDRLWKPNLNTRRVLKAAWGGRGSAYVGKRVHLVRDPNVKWAGKKVGGVRIAAMSDIAGPVIAPQMDGSNSTSITVQPLKEPARSESIAQGATNAASTTPDQAEIDIATITDKGELGRLWTQNPKMRKTIEARVAELDSGAA